MGRAFISYARADLHAVVEITNMLDEEQIPFFRDVDRVQLGAKFEDEISKAILNCNAVIAVVSIASLQSNWCNFEIGYARALGKPILPIHISLDMQPPDFLRMQHARNVNELRNQLLKAGYHRRPTWPLGTADGRLAHLESTANIDRINGKWCGTAHQYSGEGGRPLENHATLVLFAQNSIVSGDMTLEAEWQGRYGTWHFKLLGNLVSGRFLWINYQGVDDHHFHFGTILCDLSADPLRLLCRFIGYGALSNQLVSGHASLRKVLTGSTFDNEGF